jgi:hypothetical protein
LLHLARGGGIAHHNGQFLDTVGYEIFDIYPARLSVSRGDNDPCCILIAPIEGDKGDGFKLGDHRTARHVVQICAILAHDGLSLHALLRTGGKGSTVGRLYNRRINCGQ